jgi:hypothetical protein
MNKRMINSEKSLTYYIVINMRTYLVAKIITHNVLADLKTNQNYFLIE